MMQDLVGGWLKRSLKVFQVFVGNQSTDAQPEAKLLDIHGIAAAYLYADLCQSVLVMSRRLLLVETRLEAMIWRDRLTETWIQHPGKAAETLKRRASHPDANIFAQVQATKAQLSMAKARATAAGSDIGLARPERVRMYIDLSMDSLGPATNWRSAFIYQISQTTGIPLQEAPAGSGVDVYQWQPLQDFQGHGAGRIAIQLTSAQEVQRLAKAVRGKGVEVMGQTTAIAASSEFLPVGILE